MSYPILYSATETNFDHNGLGILGSCVSCDVTEEANGIFELAMAYPMDGIHFESIGYRSIIKAKPDQFREPQLFRVYGISKPDIYGIVTFNAEHISYDLSGITVSPFSAENVSTALQGLKNNADISCPFDFWTDKSTSEKFKVPVPSSIRSRLGGVAGSILDVYGGEYEFDNYTVKLHNNRGMNRGVSIRYGKNLKTLSQEENCRNVATGVRPFWSGDIDGNAVLVELPEKIVNAPGTYNFVKIRTLDLSAEFETRPTVEQLRAKAESYVKTNNIGVPKVSLSVSFVQLEQYEEYKNLKLLERVSLFDTVNVEFPALGVSATAKAVKIVYDVLADRVKYVTLGSVRSNIADTIAGQNSNINNLEKDILAKPTKTDLEKAKEAATSWLTNGKGYAYFRKDDFGNIVDILFMDTQDAETAVNVMRVGQSGIGFSHNGVSGPYESAWTIDGKFNADFITTGIILATLIKAGVLQSKDGKTFFLDLDNGILRMQATEFSISGKTVEQIAQEKADIAENNAVGQAGDIAQQAVDAQTQQDIFNKLTNDGAAPGIFLKDGQLYINAAYLATGIISSADGTVQIDLDNGTFSVKQEFANALAGTLYGMFEARKNGIAMYGCDSDTKELVKTLVFTAAHTGSRGGKISQIIALNAGLLLAAGEGTGEGYTLQLGLPNNKVIINNKTVSWKDNGDGTFTLTGK